MVYIPPQLVIAGAQAGLGFLGDFMGNKQQERQQREQLKFQRRQQQFEVAQANKAIDQENRYNQMVHAVRKRQGAEQKRLSTDAANRAYLGNAINRDRQLASLAFDRSDRQAQLYQAMGRGRASMQDGNRSAMRAMLMDTQGVSGRLENRDKLRVQDINTDGQLFSQDVQGQLAAQFAQIDAMTEIAPMMRQHVQLGPMASMPRGMSGMQTAVMGLNHLAQGAGTYMSLGGKFGK